MVIPLSPIEIILSLLAVAILCLVGISLHRMVKARDKMLREFRRREQVHQMAMRFKNEVLPDLRPLGMRRISLTPYRKSDPVLHRRRLNLHTRLFHQDLL